MGRIREALFAPWDRRRPAEASVPHEAIQAADAWMIGRLRAGLDARLATAEERVGIFAKAALPHFQEEAKRRQGHRTDLELGGISATKLDRREKHLARDEAAATVGRLLHSTGRILPLGTEEIGTPGEENDRH